MIVSKYFTTLHWEKGEL